MTSDSIHQLRISIRDIERLDEIRAVEDLQIEVWGRAERDVVPLSQLVAVKHVSGTLIGAFDDATLVGFAYGFFGLSKGHLVLHSHMLAVRPAYRNFNLGYLLKHAQRERVLAHNITRMTWTFDPLQSLNAYFNFNKLGVVSDTYKVNIYGEQGHSFLHRNGTDRFFVTWLLDSPRAKGHTCANDAVIREELADAATILRVSDDLTPQMCVEDLERIKDRTLAIEIPSDINSIERADTLLARRWREETRRIFTATLSAGYVAHDFHRFKRDGRDLGVYLLSLGQLDDFAS